MAAYLDTLFGIDEAEKKKEWKPFLVAASKTTWRKGRNVDSREVHSARMTTDVTLCGSSSGKGKSKNRDRPDFLQFFRKLVAQTKLLVLRLHIILPYPPGLQQDSRITYTRCQTPNHKLRWYEMSVLVDKDHLVLFQYIKESPKPKSPFEKLANYLHAKECKKVLVRLPLLSCFKHQSIPFSHEETKPYLTIASLLQEETRPISTDQKRSARKEEGKGKEKMEEEDEEEDKEEDDR